MNKYSSFVEYWEFVSPPWLRGYWGLKLISQFGKMQDEALSALKDALKSKLPARTTVDALQRIGYDRGMPKWSSTETYANYRSRIANAWTLWQDAGTDAGILRALSWVGFQDCSAYPPYNPNDPGYTPDPSQTVRIVTANDFGDDNRPDYPNTWWNVFWIFAEEAANSLTSDAHTWADSTGWETWGTSAGEWDSYGVWDFDIPKSRVDNIRQAIWTWKPSHMSCPCIIIATGLGAIWGGPGVNWADSAEQLWDGSGEDLSLYIGEPS